MALDEQQHEQMKFDYSPKQGESKIAGGNAAPTVHATLVPSPEVVAATDLRSLWTSLRVRYFPTQRDLDNYSLCWSFRNHRCTLASCNVDRRRILVAHLMGHPDALNFLEPLLFHEMCHAALGKPKRKRGRRVLHGREFKALERLHPGIAELDGWIKAGGWHRLVRLYALAR